MPYISSLRREDLFAFTEALRTLRVDNAGEVNYLISMIFKRYLEQHGYSYRVFNELVGAATCARMELYRRLIGPMEDGKIKEHGDIF